MNKKVLFISDHGDPLAKLGGKQAGGQNNYVYHLALAMENRGWDVDVITHWCDKDAPQMEAFGKRSRVIRIQAGIKGFVSKNEMFQILPAFFKEIEELVPVEQYDIIHTHYWLSGILGRQLRRKYNIPFVHTSHSLGAAKERATGERDERRFQYERTILRSANRVIATTNSEKSLIHDFTKQPAPVDVIPIGVSPTFYPLNQKPAIKQKLDVHGPLVFYAGRLEETKGVETLLKAFRYLIQWGDVPSNTRLILAGGQKEEIGDDQLPIQEKQRSWVKGIERYVQFVGPKSQEELAEYFNAANVAVVPSYYESFGMVAAEAQACGCPVIASRVGGLQNVVVEGETGLLVNPKDAQDLALTLEIILNNNIIAQRLGKQASSLAERDYRWPNVAARVEQVYEEVLSGETRKRYTSFSY
ncbi:glycosyltransferase [Fictibacillus sp. B-59209]|uniref:glycosyltransferase n=1 Tax=Fictibacillus sp. B-59209 TaxID=3024873 RepID=UPI002E2374C6|nr:glycosyltransferase [Fictibacillus sp. B-59209]